VLASFLSSGSALEAARLSNSGGFILLALLFTKSDGDNSFTLSYDMPSKRWISFHSYKPQEYHNDRNMLYTINNNGLYKHDVYDKYITYYGGFEGIILDYTATHDQDTFSWLQAEIFTEAKRGNNRDRDITFNGVVIYNDEQCTGDQNLIVKNKADVDFYLNQITNTSGIITVSKNEGYWTFNDFRDYRDDYSDSIFDSSWSAIQTDYYIDKIVKSSGINLLKNWWELQQFRSNFAVIRLKFEGNNDVQLTTQYIF